jgi:hypothetical protein
MTSTKTTKETPKEEKSKQNEKEGKMKSETCKLSAKTCKIIPEYSKDDCFLEFLEVDLGFDSSVDPLRTFIKREKSKTSKEGATVEEEDEEGSGSLAVLKSLP